MSHPERLARLEDAYLDARDARDRLDVARATGEPSDVRDVELAAAATEATVRAELAAMDGDGAADELPDDDARALLAIRAALAGGFEGDVGLPVSPPASRADCDDPGAWATAIEAGGTVLRTRLEACYGAIAADLAVDGETLSRPRILGRLGSEPDPERRRRLFLALAPLWRMVDGDGGPTSPYRALIRESAVAWAAGDSPIAANEAALGLQAGEVERWATGTLDAWREAVTEPARARGERPIEPWDWWWQAGEAERALDASLPLERVFEINRRVHASLGADLDALDVHLDTTPRAGRPPVPVAFTTFGARPRRRPDGSWSPGAPTVLASYVDGGLGELSELVHETGHAIHIGAIRTRPAFTDWPDSDALTEALAELVSLDTAEPAWQRRWIDGAAVAEAASIRCRYAEVAIDAAWALLEIRLHADPERAPNDVWTVITERYLGIAPHPEWSWWAMRGQLVQEPGYMANYAIGAVLAADLRATIRSIRGDWTDGDPGWFAWVSDRVYRFGLDRPAGAMLRDVLGRAPTEAALRVEIARARG